MHKGTAKILFDNESARSVVASAGRISTTQGTALSVFDRAGDEEKDLKLIKKVLSSGHKSVMEHQMFSIAFDDVSVLAEQFMIEHRLASYTVKSRRYVDHSGAGYVIPDGMDDATCIAYCEGMDSLFELYAKLCDAGVPKEDARFVLPYSFRSNFYMTLNGREMIRLVSEMVYGRGNAVPELKELGQQLEAQLERLYPGILAGEEKNISRYNHEAAPGKIVCGGERKAESVLLGMSSDPVGALTQAMAFYGRFEAEDGEYVTERNMMALVRDARPRELEFFNARFIVKNVSLACVTHFTRHRILSLIVPNVVRALENGFYVVPESIRADEALLKEYENAFEKQAELANRLRWMGLKDEDMGYLALAGHVIDIMFDMNGRELLHFLKLRTCTRAQWEIRGAAKQMLSQLREACDDIFWVYGPSCLVDGRCPEGRLSCGKPEYRQER